MLITLKKGVLSILGVCSKTSTQRKKETLLVYDMLQIKRTNLEKVPGFEMAKLISLGFHLCESPKTYQQLLNGYSDHHHSSLNLETSCRLKMMKMKKMKMIE